MWRQQVARLLVDLCRQGERRITAIGLNQLCPSAPVAELNSFLHLLVGKKLTANYELECPYGHADFRVDDLTATDLSERTCRLCDTVYTPDLNRYWLTFSFTPEFKTRAQTTDPGVHQWPECRV